MRQKFYNKYSCQPQVYFFIIYWDKNLFNLYSVPTSNNVQQIQKR